MSQALLIQLNGKPHPLPEPVSVRSLLEALGIDPLTVAVELDRVVIKKARYADTMVGHGAEVEIVAFVGGGSSRRPQCAKLGRDV